jgi:hypothetical protein
MPPKLSPEDRAKLSRQELGDRIDQIAMAAIDQVRFNMPALRLLQFLPDSPDAARHARDGSGDYGPGLEFGGSAGVRWLRGTTSRDQEQNELLGCSLERMVRSRISRRCRLG